MVWILQNTHDEITIPISIVIWLCFWPSTFWLVVALLFFGTGYNFFVNGNAFLFRENACENHIVNELIGSEFCFCFDIVPNQLLGMDISVGKACAGHIKLLLNIKSRKCSSIFRIGIGIQIILSAGNNVFDLTMKKTSRCCSNWNVFFLQKFSRNTVYRPQPEIENHCKIHWILINKVPKTRLQNLF